MNSDYLHLDELQGLFRLKWKFREGGVKEGGKNFFSPFKHLKEFLGIVYSPKKYQFFNFFLCSFYHFPRALLHHYSSKKCIFARNEMKSIFEYFAFCLNEFFMALMAFSKNLKHAKWAFTTFILLPISLIQHVQN